jgi:hypothetical protein
MSNSLTQFWANSDLVVIVGDQNRTIGDGEPYLEERFNIEGAAHEGDSFEIGGAVLTFSIRGMTAAGQQPVVEVNDQQVGVIPAYPGADRRHWHPEAISISAGILAQGENEIEIRVVGPGDPAPGEITPDPEITPDLEIRDLICHYQFAPSG